MRRPWAAGSGTTGTPYQLEPPPDLRAWLNTALAQELDAREGPDLCEEEHRVILQVLRAYSHAPAKSYVAAVTDWVRLHITTLSTGGKALPTRWMWEWVLYLCVLEQCGIAELRFSDPALQEDLLAQLNLPTWAKNTLPFPQWMQGRRAMQAGHAYTGMKMAASERARSLTTLVPSLPAGVADRLSSLAEGAFVNQPLTHTSPATGNPRSPITPEEPDGSRLPKRGSSREVAGDASSGPASSPKRGRLTPNRPEGLSSPPPTPTTTVFAPALAPQGARDPIHTVGPINNMVPLRGIGKVTLTQPDGGLLVNVCAASSIAQLVCVEYRLPFSETVAAKIAEEAQRWTSACNGSLLEISDVWWVALKSLLPQGPWPGLIVLNAQHNKIWWDRTTLLRIPGPADDKLLAVIGNGRHFDPVWWTEPNGPYAARNDRCLRSSCPAIPRHMCNIIPTLTPHIGPAAGTLLLIGAIHLGVVPYNPGSTGPCTEHEALHVVNGQVAWQPWVQHIRQHLLTARNLGEPLPVAMFRCSHPVPPYPDIWCIDQGVIMLSPQIRLVDPRPNTDPANLLLLAFDSSGCHVGTLAPPRAGEALTWLRHTQAVTVTAGHQGP